ncbi:hypothetical protein [Muricoccus pecuniae]|uniref:Uncharacterized protein n=1 Tax=Muricoccus pecuniae TaxID=693023 RepID=A0A840YAY2_9PROT|nr:hypothetical protein [Roseomonas pecuniae]MBB5693527.1 hypothetical protein [Roseomonas pecuniae]
MIDQAVRNTAKDVKAARAMTQDDEIAARLAELLDDPLPPDWRDPRVTAARQAHLYAVSFLAGEAALDAMARHLEWHVLEQPADLADPVLERLFAELAALARAMGKYTHETQRDDAMGIVHEAMEQSAGATVAAFIIGIIKRLRAAA